MANLRQISQIQTKEGVLDLIRDLFTIEIFIECGSDHAQTPEPIRHCLAKSFLEAAEYVEAYNAKVKKADGGWSWATIKLTLKPPPNKFTLRIVCEGGHTQHIDCVGMTKEMVVDYGSILDGTSPFFVVPPGPDTRHNKCTICGRPFKCEVLP